MSWDIWSKEQMGSACVITSISGQAKHYRLCGVAIWLGNCCLHNGSVFNGVGTWLAEVVPVCHGILFLDECEEKIPSECPDRSSRCVHVEHGVLLICWDGCLVSNTFISHIATSNQMVAVLTLLVGNLQCTSEVTVTTSRKWCKGRSTIERVLPPGCGVSLDLGGICH